MLEVGEPTSFFDGKSSSTTFGFLRRRSQGIRDRAIILLLARLGLRAGDVAGLRLSDIDWQNGTVLVVGKGTL